jgi:hypothetical protein
MRSGKDWVFVIRTQPKICYKCGKVRKKFWCRNNEMRCNICFSDFAKGKSKII